jgi:hypothetical protein
MASPKHCTWKALAGLLPVFAMMPPPALAQDAAKSNLSIAIVVARNAPNYSANISTKHEGSGCSATGVELGRTLETQLPGALAAIFPGLTIEPGIDTPGAANADVLVSLAWSGLAADMIDKSKGTVSFELQITANARGSSLLSKKVPYTSEFAWDWGAFSNTNCNDFRRDSAKAAREHLVKAVVTAIQERDVLAALQEVEDERSGQNATLLSGLQPMDAKYRVTDSEASIRRRPDTKGPLVRKVALGTQLQVIGQLPSGWLQVAREGEPIGWVHSGSVAAFSVQAPPAVAAVPTRPTKPMPAPVAVPPAPTFAAAPAPVTEAFPTKPVAVSFPRGKPNPDDIAVIIGNANYKSTAKDIPDVIPAYADAEGMKRYATQALGIKEENVIFIKDAKLIDLVSTFGTADDPKGKLFNWVKPGQSNVFIFYSGHGAPSADGASSYLVPVDAQAALINLSGYNLKTLYANLGKLPAKSVTVVLEACFSGASQSGMLVKNASPIYQKAMAETVPANLTVISAGSGNQIASWEQDKSHGLFTKHYLLGMAGAADKKPYGDGDGKVTTEELTAYLKGTMSYMAQRYYGREQTVQVATGVK